MKLSSSEFRKHFVEDCYFQDDWSEVYMRWDSSSKTYYFKRKGQEERKVEDKHVNLLGDTFRDCNLIDKEEYESERNLKSPYGN
jgi:hypothetical protein